MGGAVNSFGTALRVLPSPAPGVVRKITSVADLERLDPRFAGLLQQPIAPSKLPEGMAPRIAGDGNTVIVSLNAHTFVPGDLESLAIKDQRIGAMIDDAAFINALNPDVVLLQELRNQPIKAGAPGIGDAVSVFAHMIGASDVAFTPAIPGYGTGGFLRNDFKFAALANMRLATEGKHELRGAGVGAVVPPDGRRPFNLEWYHLANDPLKNGKVAQDLTPLRGRQLQDIGEAAVEMGRDGRLHYTSVDGENMVAEGFIVGDRTMTIGDHNQPQAATDAVLAAYGLRNINDLLAESGLPGAAEQAKLAKATVTSRHFDGTPWHSIDYGEATAGVRILDSRVLEVPKTYFPRPSTDHSLLQFTTQ